MAVTVRSSVLGNLDSFPVGTRVLERVSIGSDELAKRILRFTTSAGEIGLRLASPERLRDGDVIFADERIVAAISVEADEVLIFAPDSLPAAIRVAHALGNRHLPIALADDGIVVRFDPLLEALGAEHGVAVRRERRVLAAPFRHAHAPHGHD